MGRRIILHVGVQKTGSTYLQRRLRSDTAQLRSQGVYVPVLPSVAPMLGNAKLLAAALNRSASPSFRHVFPDIDLLTIDPAQVVADLLADWRPEEETVVLSAETFRPWQPPLLRTLLPTWAEVTVVLFVRRQDEWIESYHRQLVKTMDVSLDMHGFVDAVLERRDDRLCPPDWMNHYRAWSGAFGDCRVVFFDEVRSDLLGALFSASDLPAPARIEEVPPQQVSLDVHQLAYLLSLDRPLGFPDFQARRSASTEASARLGAPPSARLLTASDHARLQDAFSGSNQQLLARLGRAETDPVLSLEPRPGRRRTSLEEVYASQAYARHRELADAIYAGEDQEAATASSAS